MTIKYLKKAEKTPQTGSDETRNIVADMLAKIEAGGEEVALAFGRDLDGYSGGVIVSDKMIAAAAATVSPQLKDDIQFAYDRVTKFAKAQLASVNGFETELSLSLIHI